MVQDKLASYGRFNMEYLIKASKSFNPSIIKA